MPDQCDNFIWRETAPDVWQRDIDEVEQFYTVMARLYEGSDRVFFAITGHLSLRLTITKIQIFEETEQRLEESTRFAWLRVRDEQPTIASCVRYDTESNRWKKTYRVVRDVAAEKTWLKETFRSISTGQSGAEWCNDDPPCPELPTLFFITPRKRVSVTSEEGIQRSIRRDIVLRSHHDIIDGIGTLLLLNRLVALTAETYTAMAASHPIPLPAFDHSEVARLSPPYRVAAGVPPTPTPAQQRRLDLVATTAAAENEPETIGVPYKSGAVFPGKHQRVAETLSMEETSRILAACKALGVTVTHAYHAAAALTLCGAQERKPEPRRVQYVNYILRNERQHCAEPYDTDRCAASVYHSVSGGRLVVEMTVPGSYSAHQSGEDWQGKRQDFRRILGEMKAFYCAVRDDDEHYALAPYISAARTPKLPLDEQKGTRLAAVPPPKALPSVSISSMGCIDNIIAPENGPFSVDDPWVTGEELTNGLGLFLGTFRGQLCLSAAYNEAWHDEDSVVAFLRRCHDIVFQGLEI